MAKIICEGARLSSNPQTQTTKHEQGLDGLVNITTNGKLFYVVDFIVMNGATPVRKTETIWADENGKFAMSMKRYNQFNLDEVTEGELVRFEDVPPYEVNGKVFNHVTLLVRKGSSESAVLSTYLKRTTPAVKTEETLSGIDAE